MDELRTCLPTILVFIAAGILVWTPGNYFVVKCWRFFVWAYAVPKGGRGSVLAPAVGGLERLLFVLVIMWDKIELIPGWLVMKAFFGWIGARENTPAPRRASATDPILNRYNAFLLVNLCSLFYGLLIGKLAELAVPVVAKYFG
jgi:hypothetical protein